MATTPAPAPASTPAPAPAPAGGSPDRDLRFATVHLASDRPGTWLELRNFVDSGDWSRACQAPCDRVLLVEGWEARVTAPGMTTSNEFRIEPGRGRALVKVEGGSATARSFGIAGLAIGIPVSMIGMGLLGYGIVQDEDALQIGGGITLGVGATIVLGSLPLLVIGSTDVHDGRGRQIAGEPTAAF